MERYEVIKDIGSGNFGVAKLVRDIWTKEFYAAKFIERGEKVDEHVQREIMNHRSLKHPNIVRFKEALVEEEEEKQKLEILREIVPNIEKVVWITEVLEPEAPIYDSP